MFRQRDIWGILFATKIAKSSIFWADQNQIKYMYTMRNSLSTVQLRKNFYQVTDQAKLCNQVTTS